MYIYFFNLVVVDIKVDSDDLHQKNHLHQKVNKLQLKILITKSNYKYCSNIKMSLNLADDQRFALMKVSDIIYYRKSKKFFFLSYFYSCGTIKD